MSSDSFFFFYIFAGVMIAKKQIVSDADFGQIFIVTRRTVRNVTMRMKEDGLHVTTPPFRSVKALLDVIRPFRERLLKLKADVSPKPFDWDYRLEAECFRLWLEPGRLKHFTVRSAEEGVKICCPEDTDFSDKRVQTLVRNAIARALKKRAEEYLPPLVACWAERYGLSYRTVKITKARSRWGSCSSERHISLSYYLMLLPAHLMDYVVLHELAHTREMNHGPHFWELLDRMTEGRALALRKELRAYRPVF